MAVIASKPRALQDTVAVASTGVKMPLLGFGVYQLLGDDCVKMCEAALAAGYRHFDSAQMYHNEAEVGKAMLNAAKTQGIARSDVFLTTKIFSHEAGSGKSIYESVAASATKLGGGGSDAYVDLFLVHWPRDREFREDVWKALEKLYEQGKAKTIGVSNFSVGDLEEMKEYATIWPPHVNQIEASLASPVRNTHSTANTIQLHPWKQQREIVDYCQKNGIILQAYSPLDRGKRINDPAVVSAAKKHSKSPAQVLIRYSLQKGWVPLPKSANPDRMKQNTQVYDFELDSDDLKALDALEK